MQKQRKAINEYVGRTTPKAEADAIKAAVAEAIKKTAALHAEQRRTK